MKRSLSRFFLAGTMSLAVIAGCDDDRMTRDTTPPPSPTPYSSDPRPGSSDPSRDTYGVPRTDLDDQDDRDPQPQQSDASQQAREALGFVIVIDRNEIDASAEALKKELSEPVREFAEMLYKQHSENMEKTMRLGKQIDGSPIQSPEAEKLRTESETKLKELGQLNANEFEKQFIEAMVVSHSQALELIDNKLLASAQDEKVTAHLKETRESIAMHLKKAQQLQEQTGGTKLKTDIEPQPDPQKSDQNPDQPDADQQNPDEQK